MMHQRLMFGMLVYGGVIALIVLRILYLAAFGDHAGAKRGLTRLVPERGRHRRPDGLRSRGRSTPGRSGSGRRRSSATSWLLARKLAELMPEQDEAAYFAMLRSDKSFYYLRRAAAPGWSKRSTPSASPASRSSASPIACTRRRALRPT
jgi:cell division protein FtsI (penicillin-binding protein 3)